MTQTAEQRCEYERAWRAANREKVCEYNRNYYLKNQEACKKRMREQRIANPEKSREQARKATAKINNDPANLAIALYRGVQSALRRKTRMLECTIDIPYIQSLLNRQNYRDAYYPQLELALKGQGKNPFSASVDRKDPSKGYVKGNVHIVCLSTNQQKGELTHKQMLNLVAKITGAA